MPESLGVLAKIHYGKSPSDVVSVDGEVPVVGTGGIYAKATCALFDRGVVVARKGSLGTPHLFRSPFWPSDTTYAVVPMPGIDIEWLYYCLLNFDLTKLNEATGVPSISRDWLAKTPFHNPGGVQQKRIAAILTSLDTAIEKTEALIEKHQQIKAGLMHDLFTRGVLPNGQLRPPREQAPELYRETPLGLIPSQWNICALGSLVNSDITYGIVQAGPHVDGGIPYIRTGDMSGDFFDRSQMLCTSRRIAHAYKRSEVRSGDIVMAIRATVGKVLPVPQELDGANLTQGTAKVAAKDGLDRTFLLWALRQRRFQMSVLAAIKGTTFAEITLAALRKLPLAVPNSTNEQALIALRLHRCDGMIQIEQQQRDKLRHQKLGLMQDLLTGKVPVKIADTVAVPA